MLIFFTQEIIAQNFSTIDIGRTRFSTGDVNGWKFSNNYYFSLLDETIFFQAGLDLSYGVGDNTGAKFGPEDPSVGNLTLIGVEGFYPLPDGFIPGENFDQGLKVLSTKTTRHFYANLLSGLAIKVAKIGKSELMWGFGGTFGYVDREFVAAITPGNFKNDFFPEGVDLVLTVPFYLRKLDGGFFTNVSWYYPISEKLSIGAKGQLLNYFSKDKIYSGGLAIKISM